MYKESLFSRLRKSLLIREDTISQELAEHPMLLMDATEACASAISIKDGAESALKLATAQAAAELRAENIGDDDRPKYRSEAAITSELPMQAIVQTALIDLDSAKYDAALWMGLVESMRAKQSSLKRIADMATAGYISVGANSSYSKDRDDLHQARQAASTRRRPPPA